MLRSRSLRSRGGYGERSARYLRLGANGVLRGRSDCGIVKEGPPSARQ
jgi:hypothetical protein